ncbi:MAG TPA: HAD family hydrolase [Alphaproteobacteria bacterium]|nr:HAD family hydrolase [Alphaproteobacteria bacterium]
MTSFESLHPAEFSSFPEADRHVVVRTTTPIKWPLHIELIISDLDGTLTDSYLSLESAHLVMSHFGEQLRNMDETPESVSHDLLCYFNRHPKTVESLLHDPEHTLRQIIKTIAWHKGIRGGWNLSGDQTDLFSAHAKLLLAQEKARKSFKPFGGVEKFFSVAREQGTVSAIYTNTSPANTVQRLLKSNMDPELFGPIYARLRHDERPWPYSKTDERERAFAARLMPYDKPKPNPEPILAMQENFGATTSTTLFIGEGASDFASVHSGPDHDHRNATFAFQMEGADMPAVQVETNERLRPGKHPLGLRNVEDNYGLTRRPDVILLRGGFRTLVDLVERGGIILERTSPPSFFAPPVRPGGWPPIAHGQGPANPQHH